jgi:hypothetical protein
MSIHSLGGVTPPVSPKNGAADVKMTLAMVEAGAETCLRGDRTSLSFERLQRSHGQQPRYRKVR